MDVDAAWADALSSAHCAPAQPRSRLKPAGLLAFVAVLQLAVRAPRNEEARHELPPPNGRTFAVVAERARLAHSPCRRGRISRRAWSGAGARRHLGAQHPADDARVPSPARRAHRRSRPHATRPARLVALPGPWRVAGRAAGYRSGAQSSQARSTQPTISTPLTVRRTRSGVAIVRATSLSSPSRRLSSSKAR
jgi:hypothetical protein